MGHVKHKQLQFAQTKWQFRYNHGGQLRQKRKGRGARPISTKAPIHLVFKSERKSLRRGLRSPLGFYIISSLIKKYAKRFFVKVEQVSINHDHVHLLVRFSKRSKGIDFLRVVSGQIAQQLQKNGFLKIVNAVEAIGATDTQNQRTTTKDVVGATDNPVKIAKLWKYRPFTRVIQGWKPYQIVRNYIQLNEKEAAGKIVYKPTRLKGLSSLEWEILWT